MMNNKINKLMALIGSGMTLAAGLAFAGCSSQRMETEAADGSGWTFSGLAATSVVPNDVSDNGMNIYWGDVHNHCNLTYGHGDMKDAFDAAKGQLDFVAVTPHAMWPDIPGKDDPRLKWVIDYHVGAFERLRQGGWEKYVDMTNQYNKEGEFLTFLSYECHSMQHGDHVALLYNLQAPLTECTSVPDLMDKLKDEKAFITPHHMGYIKGYRGYDWDYFKEGKQTPFVEMVSRHGLAESDLGDYNYLHDMGPRTYEGTVQYGLENGHKFGIMGSTDQHAGYPGSYGDGRMAVVAPDLKRDDIWNAMENRHVYCATGDKIKLDFRVNDAIMGDEIVADGPRKIYLNVEGENYIDYVDVIKNGKQIARLNGPYTVMTPEDDMVRAKIKVDFGWNRDEDPIHWQGALEISEGTINNVTPCFRGAAFTSPQETKLDDNNIAEKKALIDAHSGASTPAKNTHDMFKTNVNRVLGVTDKKVDLDLYTTKNPNTTTTATQAVILDVTMPKSAVLSAKFNGKEFSHTMEELLGGNKAHFMIGWLSEAIQFNRAAPVDNYTIERTFVDEKAERDTDYYYLRVRQRDNQWAFSSPIWVNKK